MKCRKQLTSHRVQFVDLREPIKPKQVAEIDLCQLWNQAEQSSTHDSEVCPE